MLRVFNISILCFSLACLAGAQAPQPADESDTVKTLLEEVRDLKARLAAVEAKQARTDSPSTPTPDPSPSPTPAPVEAAVQQQPQPGEPASFGFMRGIKFQGFGDLGWRANNNHAGQTPILGFSEGPDGKFGIGDFDLFLTSRINDKAMVLSEIVFEEGDAQSFSVNLARMLFKYDFNDYLKVSFGRYHTATSYYNQVFHSGAWLQTLAERPLAVQFANLGGILPTQAIGVSTTGKIPLGKLGLNYIFEYGSSDTIRPDINNREGAVTDESNGNNTTVGLFAKPDWLPGMEVGASFYHDRLNPTDSGFHIGQSIVSGHVVYTTPKFEFINEAFLIQHKVDGFRTFNTPAFYTLISDNVVGKWRPYFLYEYVNANSTPVILDDVGLYQGPTAGVRYDFNGYVALKAQYQHIFRRNPLPNVNWAESQLAFRF